MFTSDVGQAVATIFSGLLGNGKVNTNVVTYNAPVG